MPTVRTKDLRKARDIVIEAAGGPTAVAKHFRVSRQAVSQWARIPWERVEKLERLTGISRHTMRPDIYGTAIDGAVGS